MSDTKSTIESTFPAAEHRDGPSTVFVIAEDPNVFIAVASIVHVRSLTSRHCATLAEFLEQYCGARPGCLLVDAGRDGNVASGLLNQLRDRSICPPVIFMAEQVELPAATHAVRAGALDFLQKPFDPDLLCKCIEEAVRRDQEHRRQRRMAAAVTNSFAQLSEREREVADLLARGLNTKAIAVKLSISPKTVDTHRAHVFEKLNVSNIATLVKLMLQCEADKLNRIS